MQALLTNIELDIQELKYLMDAFSREPNEALREILRRNISQMRNRLDDIMLELERTRLPIKGAEQVQTGEKKDEVIPTTIAEEITETVQVTAPQFEITESQSGPEVQVDETIVQLSSTGSILGERIKLSTDLRRSISLNDSFRFSRELFNGDSELMNRIIGQIAEMSSLDAAIAFLFSKVDVSEENEAMADFQELLKKYFN